MEPIDLRGAPLRRWPVVAACTFVGAVIAVLLPVSSYAASMWQANAEVGLPPQDAPVNSLGSKVGTTQLEYYAHQTAVIKAAAAAAGMAYDGSLKKDVMTSKAGHGMKGIIDVAVLQPTRSAAVTLTNAFVTALGTYVSQELSTQYQNSLNTAQNHINNLEKALVALNGTGSSAATVPTTTTTPSTSTTTTTTPKKSKSTTTTTASSSRLPTTTFSYPHGAGLVAKYFAQGATTTTIVPVSTPAAPTKKELNDERGVLASDLGGALAKEAALLAAGTPVSDYTVVESAKPSTASFLPGGPSLLDHRSIRGPLGLLLGALVGVGVAYLVEGSDKRLRTAARAAEVFGLPVVTEVPGEAPAILRSRELVVPVVDVVTDPYSAKAEAYRKLHVAIQVAPLVTWVRRGGPSVEDLVELTWQRVTQALVTNTAAQAASSAHGEPSPGGDTPVPIAAPAPVGELPVAVNAAGSHPERFAVLVTSPRDEPTRSFVVANLAAVFAEAGDRVLVVTTGGLRTGIAPNERPWGPSAALGPDPDAAAIVASARPSQIPGVSSLALGQIVASPSMLALKGPSLVRAARDVVDVMLIEASLLSTQDGEALLPAVDAVVVVCESWYTTVSDGLNSQRLLARHRPPVLGLAMTNMSPPPDRLLGHRTDRTIRIGGNTMSPDQPTGKYPPTAAGPYPPTARAASDQPAGSTLIHPGDATGDYADTLTGVSSTTRVWPEEGSSERGPADEPQR